MYSLGDQVKNCANGLTGEIVGAARTKKGQVLYQVQVLCNGRAQLAWWKFVVKVGDGSNSTQEGGWVKSEFSDGIVQE